MLRPSRRVLSISAVAVGATLVATVVGLAVTRETRAPESAATSSPTDSDPAAIEQAALRDDFELVDLDAAPSAGLEGVVTTLSDLPIAPTKRTMRYLDYLANDEKGRKSFEERYRRAGRYENHIEAELQQADLPEDLVWVAAVESAMSPQATSPAGAVGLFQFMPDTADRFGLFVGNELDERRSITKSTDAAIVYLGFLYDSFGAWDLALAAYNCGEGRMAQALEDGRAALGRNEEEPVTFPELAALGLLPKETMDYVPKIHAFAIASHNREILRLDEIEPLAEMHFAEIAVPGGTHIAPIAKAASISVATLREYNPDILADRLPPGLGDMLVEVPPDRLEQTLAALPALLEREPDAIDDDDAIAPAIPRVAASKSTASKKTGRGSDARPAPRMHLAPAPMRPGAFVLSSGVVVTFEKSEGDAVTAGATLVVKDPLKARAPLGDRIEIANRGGKSAALDATLGGVASDVRRAVLATGLPRLRDRLAIERGRMYEKTGFGPMFAVLGEKSFPDAHPMHGTMLVGPTEPADDMFLEPQPTWALDVTVTLRVNGAPDDFAEPLERAFAGTFVGTDDAAATLSGDARVGANERHVLVGWTSGATKPGNEAADRLAFLLACHNRLGRWHRELRLDKQLAGRVGCSLESAPQGNVAWVLASPAMPYTVADAEKTIDAVVQSLRTKGPTETELTAARGLLRAELAKERDTATMRGMPKSRIIAENAVILRNVDHVDKAHVVAAARRLFAEGHELCVVGDR